MAVNYALRIRNAMKRLGTYRPEYENAIGILAQLQRQYDTLTERYEREGMRFEVETSMGSKKAPIVTTLESLRKDVLAYMGALGLTPAGAKKIDGARAAPEAQASPLEEMLAKLGSIG